MPSIRHSAIVAMIPACLLSVTMLISSVHSMLLKRKAELRLRQLAQRTSKTVQGVPAQANNMLGCLQKARVSARCHALAHHVLRSCEKDAVQRCQGVVAGQGNILACLTTAGGQFPRNAMRLSMRLTSASEQE
jgi:hypothetical protein